jgi:hypothetical protein
MNRVEQVIKSIKNVVNSGNKIRSITAYYLQCIKNEPEKLGEGGYQRLQGKESFEPDFLEMAHNNQKLATILSHLCELV